MILFTFCVLVEKYSQSTLRQNSKFSNVSTTVEGALWMEEVYFFSNID